MGCKGYREYREYRDYTAMHSPPSGDKRRNAALPTRAPYNGLHTLAGRKTVRPVPAGSRDDR
jgi:hypothetical protein